jgi:hypothetical protein
MLDPLLLSGREMTLGSISVGIEPEDSRKIFSERGGIAQPIEVKAEHNSLSGHAVSKHRRLDFPVINPFPNLTYSHPDPITLQIDLYGVLHRSRSLGRVDGIG